MRDEEVPKPVVAGIVLVALVFALALLMGGLFLLWGELYARVFQ